MVADEGENAGEVESTEPSSPMISKKGWIVVIAVVLLQWVFAGIVFFLQRSDSQKEVASGKSAAMERFDFLGKYKLSYDDLSFSIMTTSANMATLAMKMDILLGLTQEEKDNPSGEVPSAVEMGQFEDAMRRIEPDVRDFLQTTIGNMTIQQLLKPEGRDYIKRRIMDYANSRLEHIKFDKVDEKWSRRRVIAVKITQFILQR